MCTKIKNSKARMEETSASLFDSDCQADLTNNHLLNNENNIDKEQNIYTIENEIITDQPCDVEKVIELTPNIEEISLLKSDENHSSVFSQLDKNTTNRSNLISILNISDNCGEKEDESEESDEDSMRSIETDNQLFRPTCMKSSRNLIMEINTHSQLDENMMLLKETSAFIEDIQNEALNSCDKSLTQTIDDRERHLVQRMNNINNQRFIEICNEDEEDEDSIQKIESESIKNVQNQNISSELYPKVMQTTPVVGSHSNITNLFTTTMKCNH
ncbi:unnamed protein product [Heterobilharzia americana]|nr:unnamed protein product [Heterobilharzia americana]